MTAVPASTIAYQPAHKAGMSARAWPQTPYFEGPELDAQLDRVQADPATRAFAHELAETGLGRIDLGAEGLALCDQVLAEVEPMFDDGVYRIQDAWLRSPAVRRLATLPAIVDRLTQVYGRPAFPFQTLNFRRGSQQGLHSDAVHFHADPALFMCGVWIALEDTRPDAGPLTYVPGSHKLPVMTMRAAGVDKSRPTNDDYARTYVPALAAQLQASGLPQAEALPRKGEAVVWAANLAHGGAAITNPQATRKSLVVHFYFDGCVYYTPVHSDVEAGRLAVRLPTNVITGRPAWPNRDGRPAAPGIAAALGCAKKLLLRQPIVTRFAA